jgi:hypothetical protein
MDNLNKAVSDINEILIKYINENHHLKDMLTQHELTIKKLETQIEEFQSRPPTPPPTPPTPIEEKKKGVFWGIFDNF